MNGPTIILLIAFVVVAVAFAVRALGRWEHRDDAAREPADTFDRAAWEAQDVRPSRTTALADAQETLDAAIRAQSALHGRKVIHAGARRASLEHT